MHPETFEPILIQCNHCDKSFPANWDGWREHYEVGINNMLMGFDEQ
jgi:hypothetical protein